MSINNELGGSMEIKIRKETEQDYRKVEEITREAFWNVYNPGCNEHYLVHKMRNHKDYIEDLSFIIEVDGQIEGGIFYTHSKIIAADKKEYETITFGPVFISPKLHRQGLGRKLITHTIELAKNMGFKAIVILGHPYHYEPYGFSAGENYKISMPDGSFHEALLVLALQNAALDNISGYVKFSDVFEINEDQADDYDKTFPYKEKK